MLGVNDCVCHSSLDLDQSQRHKDVSKTVLLKVRVRELGSAQLTVHQTPEIMQECWSPVLKNLSQPSQS